ncbi:MAG TPA: energy transducer TonB [Longimicrobium sp.]|nr:energy transducer TonB [Longimicrobium sp.]
MQRSAILLALLAAAPAAAQQPAADSARVYELHEVEVLPRPQNAADFTAALQAGYPARLRTAGVGGTVQVAFVVGPDGAPGDVRVLATPDTGFNAPTLQAVSLLRFTPAQLAGRAVPVRVEQPITWRVEAAPAAAARAAPAVPDSIRVYEADSVQARPVPRDFGGFTAALHELYPQELRAEKAAAQVVVRFAVDPAGQPRYSHVVESSDPRFEAVSLQAVERLRFEAARHEGHPVWAWMEVPVEWSLDEAASGNAEDGYELSAVEELPRPLNGSAFARALAQSYPRALRDAGTQGMVQVRFRVNEDGSISHARITHSTDVQFNVPTLAAVQVLRFRPAKIGGRPVRVWVEQPIQWTVSGEGPNFMPPRYEPDRGRFRLPPNPCSVSQC